MGVTLNNGSPFIIDSGKVKFADVKLASIYASKTEVEDLRQEVAHLKSLYQEVFLMAARAVSDIADAADTDGAE
ncbi:hypothetical protein CSW62_05125 [Caulobacter sp. FWC2]|nr:hypothetical protein CSW62_05125 [Caulobacter sp. FWC2]